MRKIITAFAAASLMLVTTIAAFANTPVINHRQRNQQQRIAEGVASGRLTARESARLEAREAKIQHDKRVAKSDGEMTARERAKINRELNKTNTRIYNQKHDRQGR